MIKVNIKYNQINIATYINKKRVTLENPGLNQFF